MAPAATPAVTPVTVSSTTGAPTVAKVETVLIDNGVETPAGAPQIVKIENSSQQVQTTLRISGTMPFVDGIVRLTSADPLPEDNVRSFTCGVRPKPNVLLISDRLEESLYLRNAMQPTQLEQQGIKFCECTSVTTAQAEQQALSNYDVVMVINCQRPAELLWDNLQKFASAGGGVFAVAGSDKIQAGSWMVDSARSLLPGTPLRTVNFNTEPGNFKLLNEQHPLTREFAQDECALLSQIAKDVSKRLIHFSSESSNSAAKL